jgi:hypothetical protein
MPVGVLHIRNGPLRDLLEGRGTTGLPEKNASESMACEAH